MKRITAVLSLIAVAGLGSTLEAQGRGNDSQGIPPGHYPPPGMCRIWIDGVPPGQQSAPVDCATARRNVPDNGRVIYADDDWRKNRRDRDARKEERKREGKAEHRNRDRDKEKDRDHDNDDDRFDRDRDRDDRRDRRAECRDSNRDGWCDDFVLRARTPRELPRMESAVVFRREDGRRTADVREWLGEERPLRVQIQDFPDGGTPEVVTWFNASGQILQRWSNTDRDDRADRVEIFRDGKVVKVIR